MTATIPLVDLEPSPSVPGGGPASRWRASRITSAFAWTWLGLLLACPVVAATVVVASTRHGDVTLGGVMTLLVAGLVLLILLCGVYAAGMAAVESRIDDDMRVYGVGVRSVLHTRRGTAAWFGQAPVEVDGRPVGHVARGIGPGGAWATLALGERRYRWVAARGRLEVRTGPDDVVVAAATASARGPWRDWAIEVDDRVLRVRQHVERPVPRRTLVDDLGRAWRARSERRRLEVRLPRELSDLGAAFCLMVLAELREVVATPCGGGAAVVEDGWLDGIDSSDAGWSDAGWSDAGWSDAGWSDAGSWDAGSWDAGAAGSGSSGGDSSWW